MPIVTGGEGGVRRAEVAEVGFLGEGRGQEARRAEVAEVGCKGEGGVRRTEVAEVGL